MKRKDLIQGMRVLTPDGFGTVVLRPRQGNECYPQTHVVVALDHPTFVGCDRHLSATVAYSTRCLKPQEPPTVSKQYRIERLSTEFNAYRHLGLPMGSRSAIETRLKEYKVESPGTKFRVVEETITTTRKVLT